MASSKSVVIAALIANGAIAILKFVGYLLTQSPSMLSETYHSISDTGNQVFLLFGIRYSGREADRSHPFGYGKAQFFYSFLVAVLLFGIAGWESLKHGYHAITHGGKVVAGSVTLPVVGQIPSVWVNYAVLTGAIIFESWALYKAYQGLSKQMVEHEWETLREAFKKTSDVTTLTAFTEDSIALGGAGIAMFAIFLSRYTGNPIYDAVGSVLIGLMLMGFALALAWENKRLLIGESIPVDEEEKLRNIVREWQGVEHIDEFRTVYFGPERLIVTADVSFDDTLDVEGIDDAITGIEDAIIASEPQVRKVYIEPEI
ncbi:cation diffusion facilitator family transporter [Halomarina rubra]|uniref:Cation diffusion facilitator family transporter n=1 Tax=Halomarina rubra TaxID=2071873 RepID=A0ABD6AX25_9EURY|nr:cation diffusion facilitator family transporter [Halomarina rubra]